MLTDPAARPFTNQWMVYDYWQRADNPIIRIDAKYDTSNVQIENKMLKMKQLGYNDAAGPFGKHISMAGLQSRRLDIIHGTFRTIFKVEGANGGSCASFFWYRDDASELDIEAVTKGTSLVNNTINYTTQPSLFPDGTRIPNATLSIPLAEDYNTNLEVFHEHRFDCGTAEGAKFYLDGNLMQVDAHNIPEFGGNLQLKLWADGNKWWSGRPSSTTVTMSVKSVIAYFNISGTEDGTDQQWFKSCAQAGGPSEKTICEAYAQIGKDDNLPVAASGAPPVQTSVSQDTMTISPATTGYPTDDGDFAKNACYTTIRSGQLGVAPCVKSQAVQAQQLPFASARKVLGSQITKLSARFASVSEEPPAYTTSQSRYTSTEQCALDPLSPRYRHKSQATRNTRPMFSNTQRFSGHVKQWLFSRDEPNYSHAFGSPMKSQAARVRAPSWFNTFHARNSTPIAFTATAKAPVLVQWSQAGSSTVQSRVKDLQANNKCQMAKYKRCVMDKHVYVLKWWQCVRERSDWCFFFGREAFSLTKGLVQIVSVPVVFAWVFYISEL